MIFLWPNLAAWAQRRRTEASEQKKSHKGDSLDSKLVKKEMRRRGRVTGNRKNSEVVNWEPRCSRMTVGVGV